MNKKKYKKLYKVKTVETERGIKQKAVYIGSYYTPDMPLNEERKLKVLLLFTSIIMAVLFICMGFLNNDGSRVFYVVMPYVLQFLPISFMIVSTLSFYPKNKLTEIQYEKTFTRIRTSCTGILILSFASILGEIIFIYRGAGNTPKLELLFLVINIVSTIFAIISLQIHKKIKFKSASDENFTETAMEKEETTYSG